MNCPDEGRLQALIDNELSFDEKRQIEAHIVQCHYCSESLKSLKENNIFAFDKIRQYRELYDSLTNIEIKPFKLEKESFSDFINRGVDLIMSKYKRAAAAAICGALLVTSIAVQPVRAAVSDMLSIFRVDNIKSVTISMDEMKQIQNEIKNHKSEIDMDKLGKVNITGGQKELLSLEKAEAIVDFKPMFLPEEYNNSLSANSTAPAAVNFNMNADNVNSILKSLGAKELLPRSLDGKTFTINLPRQLNLQYIINGSSCSILETKSPEILAPEDVNIDEIYNSLVNLPVIPQDLQSRLKSIKDWKNTMYIPFVQSSMEEVDINGTKGYASDINSLNGKAQDPNNPQSAVIWYKDGVFYGIQGQGCKEDIISLARAMR